MSFSLIHYSHTCCAIFWLKYSICILPRQRCASASIFSFHIFSVFYSTNCSNSFLVFCEITKDNPLSAKTFRYVTAQACVLRFSGLSVVETAKKLEKSECWVVKWSRRNEGFEGKKRRGRPKVLNKAAKIVLKKDRYKMGDSTRSLSHLASQVSSRYMKSEG